MKFKLPHFLTEPVGDEHGDEDVLAQQGYNQSLKREWVSSWKEFGNLYSLAEEHQRAYFRISECLSPSS